MTSFMAALYNEEKEIQSLLDHVQNHVENIYLVDDGSTDSTVAKIVEWIRESGTTVPVHLKIIPHTGLPETVKNHALTSFNIPDDEWMIMLDGDERFSGNALDKFKAFIGDESHAAQFTHVSALLKEFIDGKEMMSFVKCRLFRKGCVSFSTSIHQGDYFTGTAANLGLEIIHTKSKEKQTQREKEYVQTYRKLYERGVITKEYMESLVGYHYYVKSFDE